MLKINIKPKVTERPKKKNVSAGVIVLCLFLIAAVAGVYGFLYVSNNNLTGQVKALEQKIQSQKTDNKDLFDLENKIKNLSKEIGAVNKLSEQSISYSPMLKKIASITPRDVQIKQFTCDMQSTTQKLDISGQAGSRRSIMQFRKEIEKQKDLFSDVDFTSSSQTENGTCDFKITAKIKSPNKK